MGGFLTESYARKGWFMRLLEQISHGTYDVGRDNGTACTTGAGVCARQQTVF